MAVDTLARTIAAAKARGGGGSGLPAVTSDDNGDVLAVVSGAWAKSSNALPAVTAQVNGAVLQVKQGRWQAAFLQSNLIYQEDAYSDGETPATFTCVDSAMELYMYYESVGLAINGSLVVNATQGYDDIEGDNVYTFTVLVPNNGNLNVITYTAVGNDDYPHYTES